MMPSRLAALPSRRRRFPIPTPAAIDLWRGHGNSSRQYAAREAPRALCRGWDYGESRVVGGVHFSHGRRIRQIEATAMVALMMQNADFKADLAAARAELRRSLVGAFLNDVMPLSA